MSKPYFHFELVHQSKKSKARVGKIHTPHGIIETPGFVPVATNACPKALDSVLMDQLDVQLMFCNTYHLILQPGTQLIKQAGGLHSFMNRQKPLITDSGGFQVFSLMYGTLHEELKGKGKKRGTENGVLNISEQGVVFRSYRDGQKITLTPESSVQAQKDFGADIIIPLDELPPYHIAPHALKQSFERTHRWEERSLNEHLKNPQVQAMYAVVHGGVDLVLREKSCRILQNLAFDGFGIGGSLGKDRPEMVTMLTGMIDFLPPERPRHLLGIGDIPSLEETITLGIDTFDSSHPTKCARHGMLFTFNGFLKINNSRYRNFFEPIDKNCTCYTCTHYTVAYLRHLFKAYELTAYTLASIHNITFMMDYMRRKRAAILNDEI